MKSTMEDMRHDYVVRLPQKISAVNNLWHSLESGPWDAQVLSQVYRLVHNLAGSGKSYGCPMLSQKAERVERLIYPLLNRTNAPKSQTIIQIACALHQLQSSISASISATIILSKIV